ncbi:carboxypeptidase B isoform X2 [Bactrocera neohumeralis]|uniref:carboxypeptidase B isoform X2 n=1 Tax=Bactrocera neohumeralis TaxID=98809 RepID=UPI002165FA70|nr:carboxypeptidase B isoform X2 [Bactrocera neohumeralis]
MFLKVAVIGALCCANVLANFTSYEGYKIYEFKAENTTQQETLEILAQNDAYDFFTRPRIFGLPIRVLVAPADQLQFQQTLEAAKIAYTIVNENFGQSVEVERKLNSMYPKQRNAAPGSISFDVYQRYDVIAAYMEELAKRYSSRVKVTSIGDSYEGRQLHAITITNGDGAANKNVILMDAGIHAREWIAPAAALYVIQQLVENYKQNSRLLTSYDWIIVPLLNPDGYEYSHTHERLWRKTRKPVTIICAGTDGNRNFDIHWGKVGASHTACADTFRGQTAFSEPETQALRDLMHSLTGRAKFYLTLHSYGNYLLYPWGYTSALPKNWRDIDDIARAGAAAIKTATGTEYTVGSSTNVLYAAAGGSDDYALGKAQIPISITMELPSAGQQFDPPLSKIEELASETWIGIKAMAENVIEKYKSAIERKKPRKLRFKNVGDTQTCIYS